MPKQSIAPKSAPMSGDDVKSYGPTKILDWKASIGEQIQPPEVEVSQEDPEIRLELVN